MENYRTSISLPEDLGDWVKRLAADDGIPIASEINRLVSIAKRCYDAGIIVDRPKMPDPQKGEPKQSMGQ